VENASVLDEFYWLDKDDPNLSLRRITRNRGEADPADGTMTLSSRAQRELGSEVTAVAGDAHGPS
jgi:oleate hydratase